MVHSGGIFKKEICESQTFSTKAQAMVRATRHKAEMLARVHERKSADFTFKQALENTVMRSQYAKPGNVGKPCVFGSL